IMTSRNAPASPQDAGVQIRINAGDLRRMVNEVDEALVQSGAEIYRQGNRIVEVIPDQILTAGGKRVGALRLSQIQLPRLLEMLSGVAAFEKYSRMSRSWERADCPKTLAEAYLARDGRWSLRPLLGVITAPTLGPDGSVLDRPGYDAATGLVYDPQGVM